MLVWRNGDVRRRANDRVFESKFANLLGLGGIFEFVEENCVMARFESEALAVLISKLPIKANSHDFGGTLVHSVCTGGCGDAKGCSCQECKTSQPHRYFRIRHFFILWKGPGRAPKRASQGRLFEQEEADNLHGIAGGAGKRCDGFTFGFIKALTLLDCGHFT